MRSRITFSEYLLGLFAFLCISCGKVATRLEKRNITQRTSQMAFKSRGEGDISLGPVTDFQCPDGQKLSPHPDYCDLYYTCYANEPVTLWRCYSDYLFDIEFYGCNFPYLVNCGDRLPPDARTTTSSTSTESTTVSTITPSTATSTEPITTTTEPSMMTATTEPSTTTTESPTFTQTITTTTNEPAQLAPAFTCPFDTGFFPISLDSCTQHYYGCVNGVAYLLRCPGDTYYDPINYSCEEAIDVSCSSNFFSCSQFPNGFYPVPGSYCTNVYFSCQDGKVTEKVCPGTSLFDVTRNLCAPAETVQCYLDTQTTVSATSEPSNQQTTSSSSNQQTSSSTSNQPTTVPTSTTPEINSYCVNDPNGNVSYPIDCHKYVTCIGGAGFLSVCPSGTCFDETAGICTASCSDCQTSIKLISSFN